MPSVLFVCIHNACRSQIGEAILRKLVPTSWLVASAGTDPSNQVDMKAVEILRRNGLTMGCMTPKGFDALPPTEWDCVLAIGCGDISERVSAKRIIAWDIADPEDGPLYLYEELYENLTGRISRLIRTLDEPRLRLSRAREPFHFFTRLTLTVMTGIKARDLRELLEHLRTVPESVVYQHTHRFLQQHQHLVPEPPNDIAYWVTHMLQDEELGERLAAVDTVRFGSLEDLRQALIAVIEERVKRSESHRRVPDGKELHFMRAIRFSVPTPHRAHDLAEFPDCLAAVSISSLYLHMFEARLRHPSGVNDFSLWFETHLGEKSLADSVAGLDPYTRTMEGLRSRILSLVEARIEELQHAAS